MITPPIHLRLYREEGKPETIDDFVAVYDLQALLGLADPNITCTETSGCFFRSSRGCYLLPSDNTPSNQPNLSCSEIFGDPNKPAIFILRSEYERRMLFS